MLASTRLPDPPGAALFSLHSLLCYLTPKQCTHTVFNWGNMLSLAVLP